MERKDIQRSVLARGWGGVGMNKSSGYSREKYKKRCDKHSEAWSKVEWSGVGWIWEAYSRTEQIFHLAVCRGKQEKGMDAAWIISTL